MTPTQLLSPDALTLLASLRKAGLRVRAADGKLLVSPADRLTAEQRAAIAAHRDDLLALLEADVDPFDVPPPEALWGRGPPYPSLPTFEPLPPLEEGAVTHGVPHRRRAGSDSGEPTAGGGGGRSPPPTPRRSAGGGSSPGSGRSGAGGARGGSFGGEGV